MVQLRKRKTPPPAPEKPAKKKSGSKGAAGKVSEVKDAVKETVSSSPANDAPVDPSPGGPEVGDTISLEGFGAEVETHEGTKTTLKALVDESKGGVVLFTYPKASTPGCTTQACLFRDAYSILTVTGLSIYGLSLDSPKSNSTFKTKQNLPYPLLCNPSGSLIKAIGLSKAPKGTKRGVFVVSKEGKVLAVEGGGPQATVDVVKRVVDGMQEGQAEPTTKVEQKTEDKKAADVAGEVADTAEKLDSKEEEAVTTK